MLEMLKNDRVLVFSARLQIRTWKRAMAALIDDPLLATDKSQILGLVRIFSPQFLNK